MFAEERGDRDLCLGNHINIGRPRLFFPAIGVRSSSLFKDMLYIHGAAVFLFLVERRLSEPFCNKFFNNHQPESESCRGRIPVIDSRFVKPNHHVLSKVYEAENSCSISIVYKDNDFKIWRGQILEIGSRFNIPRAAICWSRLFSPKEDWTFHSLLYLFGKERNYGVSTS